MKTTKKILAILIAVITVLGIMSVAVSAEDKPVDIIAGNVDLIINTPVAGQKPSIDYVASSENISVTAFTWYDTKTNGIVSAADSDYVYEDGREYTAKITIAAKDGYKLDDALTVTVNGEEPSSVRIQDGTITVEMTFSCDKGASGNSFFSGLKNVLLSLLKIIRDLISHIIGY